VRVDGRPKRFFDHAAVMRLFGGWQTLQITEKTVLRYRKPKWVWEAMVRLYVALVGRGPASLNGQEVRYDHEL